MIECSLMEPAMRIEVEVTARLRRGPADHWTSRLLCGMTGRRTGDQS
ncbi:MAG: hypothetical protein ACJASC_001422 [Limimaricola cinnabarinus]|jgi:hypothetical protein